MAKSGLREKSDEDLMESYKMGDALAFEVLFERYSGMVLGFLSKKLKIAKDAQDLLQEVFLKLHRSRHQYDRKLPFAPWLFSIARSVWLDSVKKRQLEDVTEANVLENMVSLDQGLAAATSGVDLAALNQLPASQREAINLRVIDDATFEEIALKLSTSPENARQLVSRGLKKLRNVLGSKKESL